MKRNILPGVLIVLIWMAACFPGSVPPCHAQWIQEDGPYFGRIVDAIEDGMLLAIHMSAGMLPDTVTAHVAGILPRYRGGCFTSGTAYGNVLIYASGPRLQAGFGLKASGSIPSHEAMNRIPSL